jgi:hypothetical protein
LRGEQAPARGRGARGCVDGVHGAQYSRRRFSGT